MSTKVSEAVMQLRKAELKRANAEIFVRLDDPVGAFFERKDAEKLEAAAETVLAVPERDIPVTRGCGEVVARQVPDPADLPAACYVQDSLEHPNVVTAQASLERTKLLTELGALEVALDLQQTVDVRNSLERLLCGELSAAHVTALTLLAQAQQYAARAAHGDHYWREYSQESTRLVNASARLMSSVNEAALTLQKLRQGGRQEVHVVQHVQVDGGQAVIAANVHPGGSSANGGGEGKGGTMPCEQAGHRPGTPTCNGPMPPRAASRKPVKRRRASKPPSGANGAVACTEGTAPEPLEATATP